MIIRNPTDPASLTKKPSKQVQFSLPSQAKTPKKQSSLHQVTSICSKIRDAKHHRYCPHFTLHLRALHLPSLMDPSIGSFEDYPAIVSFDKFLHESRDDESCHLGFPQRTVLALTLASSILQFKNTSWLSQPWNKENVIFPTKSGLWKHANAFRPGIVYDIETGSQHTPGAADGSFVDPKSAFLELSILLLEIWHHKSLQEWADSAGETISSHIDSKRNAVIRWVEVSSNRFTTQYLSAIEACLSICAGRLRTWDDEKFQRQICEDIIKPLKENCKAWQ